MNGFDLSTISGAYIGSNPISAIYLGSNKIWPTTQHDYSQDYLTFEAIEDSRFKFQGDNDIRYSLDNGNTWTVLVHNEDSPIITAGNKILWKQTGLTPTSNKGIGTFGTGQFTAGKFKVYGNIMSLLFGDNFINQTDLTGYDYAFYKLFSGCLKLIDATNLILPATRLRPHCYESMFNTCFYLVTPPKLSSTSLHSYCYYHMFNACKSLTVAPDLPATRLQDYCYDGMFDGCTSLTTAPDLPAINLPSGCYWSMFNGCSSLNYIKMLATNMASDTFTPLNNWVTGVSATGTFVKNAAMTTLPTGTSGIPAGWTVQDA